jgi:prepilin-type N-terminal cleavage/methylation domain-containing protein
MTMNRRGFSLTELLIALGLIGLMVAFATPRIGRALVRQRLRSARDVVVALHAKARAAAVQTGAGAALVFQGNTAMVLARDPVSGALDTIGSVEDLGQRYGVTLTTTRDTVRFDSRGLGATGGNTKIVVQKDAYLEGIEISAMGRVLQ